MRWNIRYQLLVPSLTLLLGVVVMSAWTALASADRARRQIELQLRDIAQTVRDLPYPLSDKVLLLIRGLSGAEYLLDDGAGQRRTTLAADPGELPAPDRGEDLEALRLGPEVVVAGESYFCNGVQLVRGPHAGGVLHILYPEALWRDALWEAVRPSLVLGAFAGLASVVLTVGIAGRLSRRIQGLERRTRLIAAGDFSPMPLPGRDDELRDLGRSVNEMAQRLAQLQETVQKSERLRLLGQVSGGLAHQLRNGVTGARLAVQLHARECDGRADPEALAVALRQLALVESHLKRFLDLGRTAGPHREPCSLTALLEEAVALLRPQCRHAHTDLRWRPPGAALNLPGDAGQLGHLFLNVLGNAVEAAGPGGWVEVRADADGGRAVVEVADSGPGPPAEVAERLFEPFVTGKRDGVGLGLAVARQAAEAHGGSISWRREDGRTCFRIELPLGEEEPHAKAQRRKGRQGEEE
jgi:signal transduction histidine kinase